MIESIEIENLRGIAHGKLEGLTPLTILVGPNGSGKSTILDAIFAGYQSNSAGSTITKRTEGVGNKAKWLSYRSNSNINPTVLINATDDSDQRLGSKIVFNVSNPLRHGGGMGGFAGGSDISISGDGIKESIKMIEPSHSGLVSLHDMYTQAVEKGRRKEVNETIKNLVPGLQHLEILTENSTPILHFVFDDYSIPATLSGFGVYSVLKMCIEFALSENGIILIEEPEVHLHTRAITQLAKAIYRTTNRGIQIILTTHSLELIDALLDAATEPDDLDKLSVFMMKLDNGKLCSARIPGKNVEIERHQIGADLR